MRNEESDFAKSALALSSDFFTSSESGMITQTASLQILMLYVSKRDVGTSDSFTFVECQQSPLDGSRKI
jgi:hypothetical protein